jgi:hypothetical protein
MTQALALLADQTWLQTDGDAKRDHEDRIHDEDSATYAEPENPYGA